MSSLYVSIDCHRWTAEWRAPIKPRDLVSAEGTSCKLYNLFVTDPFLRAANLRRLNRESTQFRARENKNENENIRFAVKLRARYRHHWILNCIFVVCSCEIRCHLNFTACHMLSRQVSNTRTGTPAHRKETKTILNWHVQRSNHSSCVIVFRSNRRRHESIPAITAPKQDLNTFELNMPNSIRPFQKRNENNNDSFVL